MPKNNFKVSVICAVRNEGELFRKCLESLVAQTHKVHEILIIDDESTDQCPDIGKEFAKKYGFIKYKRIPHLHKNAHTHPRVLGIKEAKGNVLFIVDADAYYAEDYLALCLKHLEKKDVAGSLGRIRVWSPKTIISKYRDVLYRLRYDNFEAIKKEISDGKTGVWVLKKELYDRVGGYDERRGYGEDPDLCMRVQKLGFKVVYEPSAFWWHRWKEFFGEVTSNNFAMGRLNFFTGIRKPKEVMKVGYFILPLLIVISAFFNPWLLLLIPIHMIPLFWQGIKLFKRAKGLKYRWYALLSPIVSYIMNIPYAIGFVTKFIVK
tara:strand:+ start:311 stop:1270 length:960 start_codon:yes stop_codon:yes gene_type:complete